jgi:hypothetical protein
MDLLNPMRLNLDGDAFLHHCHSVAPLPTMYYQPTLLSTSYVVEDSVLDFADTLLEPMEDLVGHG